MNNFTPRSAKISATVVTVIHTQVTKAIVLAGMGLKWEMDVAAPGHIIGTLNLRSHQAVVDITYTTKIYSITYKSSQNLVPNYWSGTTKQVKPQDKELSNPLIHRNYNGWIENLNNAIRTQVIAAGT
jgi:hypothetical protein